MLSTLWIGACGGTETSPTAKSYSISYDDGNNYEITNLPSEANSGELVSFNVKSTSVFYTIDAVYANNEVLNANVNSYSFVMPANDVTIKITTSKVDEYNDENDNLDWANSFNGVISEASTSDKANSYSVSQDVYLSFLNITSQSYITSIQSTIKSSDQSVIPDDAITLKTITSSYSNIIVGSYLQIDLKKVKAGECLIYVNLKPNNKSLGTLIKKFEVVPYGTIELDTMSVTLKFENNSKYDFDELYLNLSDQNYVYGSSYSQIQTIYLSDLIDGTITFDYIKGHKYFVSCGIVGTGDSIRINDWIGSGSSTTGFNQLKNNILELIDSNSYVQINLTN